MTSRRINGEKVLELGHTWAITCDGKKHYWRKLDEKEKHYLNECNCCGPKRI